MADASETSINGRVPAVNISETEEFYEIEIGVPGMSRENFEIGIQEGVLTISAENEIDIEEEDEGYSHREYCYDSFSRSFKLPENVNVNGIEALYENGELIITIPKAGPPVDISRKIEIA